MDSQPWRRQNVRFDPNENTGYGPPNTMSIPARFTNRLPLQSADDDSPTSRATTTIAATTQGSQTSKEKENTATATGTAGDAGASEDGSTYSSPLRLGATTVEFSTVPTTGAFTTPERASIASETSRTVDSEASSTQTSAPSTLQTVTSGSSLESLTDSSSNSAATGVAPTGAHNTALPEITAAQKHSMSSGEVAAAVIMPILAAIAIFAALYLCRRRRRNRNSPPPPFFPAMMEKMGHFRPRASSPSTISEPSTPIAAAMAAGRAAPTITNSSNNAYYTGLDTSSHGSRPSDSNSGQGYFAPRRSEGGTFTDPPPPYHDGKPPQLPAVDAAGFGAGLGFGAAAGIPLLQAPEPAVRTRSPFEDPVSPLQEHERQLGGEGAALLSPVERPATSRSNTVSRAPSISSTQYSDTASVHSARAARMSVGGPQMIMSGSPPNQRASASPLQSRRDGGAGAEGDAVTPTAERHRSVFDDPASPISSIASTEFHTLPGSRRGSVVSNLGDGP